MKTEVIVKENSIVEFFKQNLTNYDEDKIRRMSCNGDVNAYNLLNDELFLKKNFELSVDTHIYFEISDKSQNTGTLLLNKYVYILKEYDDISYIAVLKNFTITKQ
jgi:hypothetical protein